MPHHEETAAEVAELMKSVEAFNAPGLLNSWANFGGAYNPAGYYKDKQGIVHLRGLLASGIIGSSAFTLPVGYRPANTEMFPTVSNGAFGVARVLNTGDVVPFSGSNAFFSLDGITFKAV